ncbi:6-bladed beta-propeller [Parabacteroides sp. OttesenSCG-928-G07]|nr:6-bladed beta-propeller [Parabacteroides sp. OttesenSCG-928-G07]
MKLLNNVAWILILVSCSSPNTDTSYITGDVRKEMSNLTTLKLTEEIESVTYVPLKITPDDASLIDGVAEYAVTDKYIYILPVQEQRIVLFDRQGNFIKTLIRSGQGPGEINGGVSGIQADEKNNRLYLFSDRIAVYTLEGAFIQYISRDYHAILERQLDEDRFGAVSFPYQPFVEGSFGLGVFTENGDTVALKNDFYSPLVPREKSGFTVAVAATYSQQEQSILFKTGSNDTVFRITKDEILPACILALKNSDNEIIRSLDATDFSTLMNPFGEDRDIFISDLFETAARYYFRFRYNQGHGVASVDKRTGETLVEQCVQPEENRKMSDANLLFGMVGTRSYRNFPIWGRMEGDNLVQVVTPFEISLYKDIRSVSIPDDLSAVGDDDNPVFIFYKIKASSRE